MGTKEPGYKANWTCDQGEDDSFRQNGPCVITLMSSLTQIAKDGASCMETLYIKFTQQN